MRKCLDGEQEYIHFPRHLFLVRDRITAGRYKNVCEVIRAGLRLLENEESKALALKNAIQAGLDSGIIQDLDPDKYLKDLKAERRKNG